MMLFGKILVAYDGSNLSKKALEKALKLGEGSSIAVIHVYNFPAFVLGEAYITTSASFNQNFEKQAEQVLEAAKAQASPHANVTYELRQGDSSREILKYATEINADLIVIGSRGLGGIREFVLGSVSHNVAQHSKVPILIVK